MSNLEMNLVGHLTELRRRVLISLISTALLAIVGYMRATEIIEVLASLTEGELIYLTPTEAFFTEIKIAFIVGLLLALPIILYQFWAFVIPALKGEEKKYIKVLVPLSYIFFILGVAFAYFIVLPFGVRFFLGFSNDSLKAMFSLSNYISFIISLLIPFGLVFELPLLVILLVKLKLITHRFLTKNRRYVIVLIFIFGVLLTPPDIVSQTMIALPLIFLYEVSIIIARIID
ncbi:twin-arginine translocase subunit TatC [Halonatronum saccharophilum]|uniref:twin-arginine translocase subunit TatC n=1 Tax=Halonatronum saccharophilum TaxID=150060 RepID=UPI0004B94199|nr:twin-arginine translocase subunit TatC [Halonatronum saccharophilum]